MIRLPQVQIHTSMHYEKEVIQVIFERNVQLEQILRTTNLARWSKTMRCWYIPNSKLAKQELRRIYDGSAQVEDLDRAGNEPAHQVNLEDNLSINKINLEFKLSELGEENLKKIAEFKNWMRSKRYSESTIETYIDALKTFLRFCSGLPINEINHEDVIRFNNDYIIRNKLSASFQNQVVNAIKLFFRTIEMRSMDLELIHRPKRAAVLPNVLSKEEIKQILSAHRNIKHKAMLSLIYSCGLRRSELLNLKLKDIDSRRGLIIVRQAKGRKDRIVPLSEKILKLLREYFIACKPKEWLFEGQSGKGQYDERSLANVLKQALEKCKINKPVSLHWLRHSYATHLLENGTDLRYIQEILGHSRSTTTEIYTHVSNKSIQNVISPFDSL